ncbi:hypothetical protein [Geobacillus zalihae]|uniref:hypothetical protein n=1 Tax=Geobacillus zalihae TaxID=213419 RepID=UPI000ACDEF1D|nr:hypothetical protein [Geobacillus zalihae]
MVKSLPIKISSLLLTTCFLLSFFSSAALADTVLITSFTSTTKESTTSVPKNYHHFYSTKDTVKVTFKVDEWIKTRNIKKVNVQLQKSNGLWWSTKTTKSVTSTSSITFSVNAGSGDYRLVVWDEPEPTGWDKPPLYYPKSTRYSVDIWGID